MRGSSSVEQRQLLNTLLPGEWTHVGRGMFGYDVLHVGPAGARVLSSTGREDVHVILPGEFCRAIGRDGQRRLLRELVSKGAAFTRVDLAGDDSAKLVRPRQLRKLYDTQGVSRALTVGLHESYSRRRGVRSFTFELGRRGSRAHLRVYERKAASRKELDAIRWEQELRDEYATAVARELLASDVWGEVWARWLVRLVDFRERDANRNITRCPRVAWFERLVGAVRRAVAPATRVATSLESKARWVADKVAPTLALLVCAKGPVFLERVIQDALPRIKPSVWALVSETATPGSERQ